MLSYDATTRHVSLRAGESRIRSHFWVSSQVRFSFDSHFDRLHLFARKAREGRFRKRASRDRMYVIGQTTENIHDTRRARTGSSPRCPQASRRQVITMASQYKPVVKFARRTDEKAAGNYRTILSVRFGTCLLYERGARPGCRRLTQHSRSARFKLANRAWPCRLTAEVCGALFQVAALLCTAESSLLLVLGDNETSSASQHRCDDQTPCMATAAKD